MYFDSVRWSLVAFVVSAFAVAGCDTSTTTVTPTAVSATGSSKLAPTSEDLKRQIDDALDFTFQRRLDTNVNAAWQIIHGCIPFKREFLIRHEGKDVRAIEYLFGGGTVEGWEFEPGVVLDPATARRGLRAIPRPGSNIGQGHDDQWIGYFSGCQMPLDTKIVVGGETYTLGDYLAQTEFDVPHNVLKEYSWTLMALSQYHDYDYSWTASDGNTWSIARLIESELEQDINASACGGAHRMTGLALALNKCKAQGGKMEGVWQRLDERIKQTVAEVRDFQNPDGSLSSYFFEKGGKSADLADAINSAGHVLEFVTVALDDEALREPWVARAVQAQCKMFRATKGVSLNCGGLYHSASGLRIYRERLYGPRDFQSVAAAP